MYTVHVYTAVCAVCSGWVLDFSINLRPYCPIQKIPFLGKGFVCLVEWKSAADGVYFLFLRFSHAFYLNDLQFTVVTVYFCSAGFFFSGTNNICSQYLAKQVLLQLPVSVVYCCNVKTIMLLELGRSRNNSVTFQTDGNTFSGTDLFEEECITFHGCYTWWKDENHATSIKRRELSKLNRI